MLNSSQSIKTHKTKFSDKYSKCLKRFQALWMVLWNIFTLHTCLLMEYNPMGINRGLCSLEIPILSLQKLVWKETQEILWVLSKIVICKTQQLGCMLKTNLQKPFSNKSVGGQILSKENNIVPPSYLFSVCLLC